MKRHTLHALLVLGVWASAARAEHATIDLHVFHPDAAGRMIQDPQNARADEEPPLGGINPRPLIKVKAKEPVILEFVYTNTYPHGEIRDACVRYFVVREEKAGQKTLPDFARESLTQGSFDVNFKLGSKVGAKVRFSIATPGIYLLRVQSERTKSDHEHFAAIDLQVE